MLSRLSKLFKPAEPKPPKIDTVMRSLMTAQKHFREAEKTKSLTDIDKALAFFTAAILDAIKNRHAMLQGAYMLRAKCHHLKAKLHHLKENFELEIKDFTSAFQLERTAYAIYKRGVAHFNLGQIALARKDMIQAMDLDKEGVILVSLERESFLAHWINCEKKYEALLSLEPLKHFIPKAKEEKASTSEQYVYTHNAAYFARSMSLKKQGEMEQAAADLKIALWMKKAVNKFSAPDLSHLYNEAMQIYFEMNQPEKAYTEFDYLISEIKSLSTLELKSLSWINLNEIAEARLCKINNPLFSFVLEAHIVDAFIDQSLKKAKDFYANYQFELAVRFYRIALLGYLEMVGDQPLSIDARLVSLSCNEKEFKALILKDENRVFNGLIQRYQVLFQSRVQKPVHETKKSAELTTQPQKVQQETTPTQAFHQAPSKPKWLKELKKTEQEQRRLDKLREAKEEQQKKEELDKLAQAELERTEKEAQEKAYKAHQEKIKMREEKREQERKDRKAQQEEQVRLETEKQEQVKRAKALLKEQRKRSSIDKKIKPEEEKPVIKAEPVHLAVTSIATPPISPSPMSAGISSLFDTPTTPNNAKETLLEKSSVPVSIALETKQDAIENETKMLDVLASIRVEPELNRIGQLPEAELLKIIEDEQSLNNKPGSVNLTFIVGGKLRNIQAGISHPTDVDIVTNASPEEVKTAFTKHAKRFGVTDIQPYENPFGTLTVIKLQNKEKIEVVSSKALRDESVPVLERVVQDAYRRNFTVNALLSDRYGNLFSPNPQSIIDVMAKRIRTNRHIKELLRDDPLSMLIMINLTHVLGSNVCEIFPGAIETVQKLAHTLPAKVPVFKLHEFLDKLFTNGIARLNFEAMLLTGIFQQLFPDISSICAGHHQWILHQLDEADARFRKTGKCSINRIYMIFVIAAAAGDLSFGATLPAFADMIIANHPILNLNFKGCSYKDSLQASLLQNLLSYVAKGRELALQQQRLIEVSYAQQAGTFFQPNAVGEVFLPPGLPINLLQPQNIIQQSLNHNQY